MKVLDLVKEGERQLRQANVAFGHGTTNAFDEAAWLVLWRLGLPLDRLDSAGRTRVSEESVAAVRELIGERIRTRKPTAYLTGEAWLQGVPFHVDERVIVPRSFIAELLAEGVVDAWLPEGASQMLDLCTGNGSLAVLCAMAWPNMKIDATDLSAEALEVARINVQRHGMGKRIHLMQSDGLASVGGPYDLIICNPPYVNAASMARLPPEYRAEPTMALAGGSDGMDFVRELMRQAPSCLTADGVLVLEIGNERPFFDAAFPQLEAAWLDTSAGSDQALVCTRDALLAARATYARRSGS